MSVRVGSCHCFTLRQNGVAARRRIDSWHAVSGRLLMIDDKLCKGFFSLLLVNTWREAMLGQAGDIMHACMISFCCLLYDCQLCQLHAVYCRKLQLYICLLWPTCRHLGTCCQFQCVWWIIISCRSPVGKARDISMRSSVCMYICMCVTCMSNVHMYVWLVGWLSGRTSVSDPFTGLHRTCN